jgi:hypothetical protein
MNAIKWLIMLCLVIPAISSAIVIDIINYSKDNVLVSSNSATTESSFGRKYTPIVYPAEDIKAHHPQNDPNKPTVPAKKAAPTTYIFEAKNGNDFFYFSTNHGIYYVDKIQDRWIVWRQSEYGSKDLQQSKQLAAYNDAQKIQKILITISQRFEPTVEPKL